MASPIRRDLQRPVIGVTGSNRRFSPSWLCIRFAVWLSGGSAVRITVNRRTPIEQLDGLVISGGDDIHPSLFDGEPSAAVFYDTDRDAMEKDYIEQGCRLRLPILGICRGHQLINVTFGGSLHVDIRQMRALTHNRRGLLPTKTANLTPDTTIAAITGKPRIKINSLHFQAVNRLAAGFAISARDLDGICQAIEHRDLTVLGVQWHPEYLFYLPAQLGIFRWLVQHSRAG